MDELPNPTPAIPKLFVGDTDFVVVGLSVGELPKKSWVYVPTLGVPFQLNPDDSKLSLYIVTWPNVKFVNNIKNMIRFLITTIQL